MFVAAVLKAKGYQGGEVPDRYFHPITIFIRNFGFGILLLLLVWTFLAVFIARMGFGRWYRIAIFLVGIAAVLFGIYGYVMLGLS